MGRWHPLGYVLALAVCAFTAAGHDSPVAIAEWAAACSQATLAALGGRRNPWTGRARPPSARTFSRVFARIDAGALNAAVHGYLDALDGAPAGPLPEVTAREREQRRAARAGPALEEQRNGEWRYLEFLQVTSLITADIFMREIPGGTRARHGSRPVDLPEHRY